MLVALGGIQKPQEPEPVRSTFIYVTDLKNLCEDLLELSSEVFIERGARRAASIEDAGTEGDTAAVLTDGTLPEPIYPVMIQVHDSVPPTRLAGYLRDVAAMIERQAENHGADESEQG